ncbi:MAG TPA: hypothetical protein VF783_20170 [Terriglobales bacterium]
MKSVAQMIALNLILVGLVGGSAGQEQKQAKTTTPEPKASSPRAFGQSYATLLPQQKRLVDDFVRSYDQTTGSTLNPEQAYNGARVSVRTTFDAVTHALLSTKLTNEKGQSLGLAIDLVKALDQVLGEEAGAGGDRQFRMYVYLKPNAIDILSSSREFFHDKDNTVYHKGFPICYRLKNGPPSIQFSITRDERMSDIDVDYRSSTFPKALFDGHLTAGNSDVRAGGNLDTHDNRWAGLNGWWREVFGFSLGGSAKPSNDAATGRAAIIPVDPRITANQGIDASVHDFLTSWVVSRQPENAIAYLSPLSYPCLENIARNRQKPTPPGMARFNTLMAMDRFNASLGNTTSVEDVFEAATNWKPELKEEKNAYPAEFRLVKVPADMARDQECVQARGEDGEKEKGDFYGAAVRGKLGDGRSKVMSMLWTKEGKYWKIVALRIDDDSDAGIIPKTAAAAPQLPNAEPKDISGDPKAVQDITSFYESWIGKRDPAEAAHYVSERSYQCLAAPSETEKAMKPADRIQKALANPLARVPQGQNLSDMTAGVQPVNELVPPVKQGNSNAFAIMAVPDQMADGFLCQNRHLPEKTRELKPSDAKYGTYYLSANRLNYGEEESPALLLLWTREKDQWMVIAWAVEVP